MAVPRPASAQGLFDFLFGGFQPRPPQQQNYPAPPAPGVGRVAPAPLGQESVTEGGGSTGHAVAFCVRLCDGQHFPVERIINGTPAETCRAICPYSKTKVFVGSEIGGAVAQDGQRYGTLETAFLYRKQLVANCTCNGRDAFGLTSFDVKRDPTLRPGDIVSTNEGLLAFTGRSTQGAAFTPINPASLPPTSSRDRRRHVFLRRALIPLPRIRVAPSCKGRTACCRARRRPDADRRARALAERIHEMMRNLF
jgi:hypothetical protein